jgi:hypothetical protein
LSKQFDKVLKLMTQKLVLDRTEISDRAKPYVDAIKMAQQIALQSQEEKKAQKIKDKEAHRQNPNKNVLKTVNSTIDTTVEKTLETVQKVQVRIVKKVKTDKFMKLTHYATCSLGVAFDMYNASRGVSVYALYDAAKSLHPEIGSAVQSAYSPLQKLLKGYMYEFALNIVDKKVNRELERLKAHGHIEDYSHIIEAYQKVHQDNANSLTLDVTLDKQNTHSNDSESHAKEEIHNKIGHVADKIYFVRAKRLEAQQKMHQAILGVPLNKEDITTQVSGAPSEKSSFIRKFIK